LAERVHAVATGKVSATKKATGRVVREKELRGEQQFDMEVGNGAATVGQTRGFKKWASDRDHGLTVEATVSVTLTCNQDEDTVGLAGRLAGALAEEIARDGIQEMNSYFDEEP